MLVDIAFDLVERVVRSIQRYRSLSVIGVEFERVTELDPITVTLDGTVHNRFEIYWCEGFRGVPGLTPGVPKTRAWGGSPGRSSAATMFGAGR